MQFIKTNEIQLLNGGYVSDSSGKPIYHESYIGEQRQARFLDLLSKQVEGKNFETIPAASFDKLFMDVYNTVNNEKTVKYVSTPVEPKRKITDALAEEALSWLKFEEKKKGNEKINSFLQQFNTINEFEEFGLFFTEGIVKLEKIYSIEEIKGFVTILQPFLGKLKTL